MPNSTACCFWIIIISGVIFLGIPHEAFARAGGAVSSENSWLYVIISVPFLVILGILINRRNKSARALAARLSCEDPLWRRDLILDRSERAYRTMQKAYMKRDIEIAQDLISNRLRKKLTRDVERLEQAGQINVIKDIYIDDIKIVQVGDYADDSGDFLWVYIKGTMFDYIINEKTGKVVRGDKLSYYPFSDLLKFNRIGDNWVMDEIISSIVPMISQLYFGRSFTHQPLTQ